VGLAVASFVSMAMLAACASRDVAERSATGRASTLDGAPPATTRFDSLGVVGAPPDTSGAVLVCRLLDDVVAVTALQASWALQPLGRHVGIVHAAIGATHYLLADSLVGYDGPEARWRIREAQRIAAPRAGEAWVTSCVVAGAASSDGTIVARVTLTPDDTLPTPHEAWRLDAVAWRFSPFPAATLSCYNEGGGP
jgi:hypothetical protein